MRQIKKPSVCWEWNPNRVPSEHSSTEPPTPGSFYFKSSPTFRVNIH